jgi:hypothetical protein
MLLRHRWGTIAGSSSVDEVFMNPIAVGTHASDPVTAQGATAQLSSYPGIDVISAA